jgi:hypothetical protein
VSSMYVCKYTLVIYKILLADPLTKVKLLTITRPGKGDKGIYWNNQFIYIILHRIVSSIMDVLSRGSRVDEGQFKNMSYGKGSRLI